MQNRKLKSSFEYTLPNGKTLTARWIKPEDKERIAEGLKMMTNESLYLRFFMPIKQLSDNQLDYFSNPDQIDHIAWGILDEQRPKIPGLGIARFVRNQDEPHIAEAAVTIPDEYQGTGLGTLMLGILHHTAKVNNIKILRAFVLSENRNLISTLSKLGGVSSHHENNVIKVDIPIYSSKADIPKTKINSHYRDLLIELDNLIYTYE